MSEAQFASWLREAYPNPALPIAIAFSGGGDSLALLLLTLRHAGGRPVYALSVDHALQEGSAGQIAKAAQQAEALGAISHQFYWHHGQITSGVQEAARKARYGLMGAFCREHEISSLVVAHSRDDQAETLWMRKQCGGGWRAMAGMSAESYAPVWPQLRDITLLRPLLNWSRESLRDVCRQAGQLWHDDPSNQDLNYLRVQARQALAGDTVLAGSLLEEGAAMRARREAEQAEALTQLREITLSGCGSAHISGDAILNEVAMARLLMCVSGHSQMADMARVRALHDAMGEPGYVSQTLGGCVIERMDGGFGVARETGRWLKQQQPEPLPAHSPSVFDGRFEITATDKGLTIAPLWLARDQLDTSEKSALHRYGAQARRGLFGIFKGETLIAAPQIGRGETKWRSLVSSRLYQERQGTGVNPA